jgi:hypothetical protein
MKRSSPNDSELEAGSSTVGPPSTSSTTLELTVILAFGTSGIPGLSWLFSKIAHFKPKTPLEDLLNAPLPGHDQERGGDSRVITESELLHHLVAIEERINQILVHLEDLESGETDDDRASHPIHEVELEEKASIDRGMTAISQLYLSALGLILDYQYETWYPSSRVQAWERPVPGSSCSSISPSTPSPSKADHQVEMDLFTAAIHALEKTIYWRSIVLRQSRIDEPHHGSWVWSTSATGRSVDRGLVGMILPLPAQGEDEEGADPIGEEIRGLEALPYLLEKTQAALVHVLTKDRQVRRQPGQGRADVPRRNGEEDVADLTPGEILRRAKYLTDLLNVFHRLPSKIVRMALSPPEQTEMNGKMVGLWIRLKAGVRRVEMLHDAGRVEESARKSGLQVGGYDPDEDEFGNEDGQDTNLKYSTEIEETFKRLLIQIERIPGDDLAPLLTRAQPWLPRTVTAGRERSFSSGSSSSSSSDQEGDSDNESDSDGDESDTGKSSETKSKRSRPTHPDPPNRPLLMRLLRMYNRYQEYRYALHLSQPVVDVVVKVESPKGKGKDMPPSARNGSGKRKLSRFREDGELGAVWRRVMWGVSEIIGM